MSEVKHFVKFGSSNEYAVGRNWKTKKMTEAQAVRESNRTMPTDLKRNGFESVVFHANMEDNGWTGIRVSYAKNLTPRLYREKRP